MADLFLECLTPGRQKVAGRGRILRSGRGPEPPPTRRLGDAASPCKSRLRPAIFNLPIAALALMMGGMGKAEESRAIEPEHARNPVYAAVVGEGLRTASATVKLPEPTVRDGQDAGARRAALIEIAGSDRKLDEMLRKSVTAPYIMKVRDVKAGDEMIRVVDLWFVVHADIAAVDPAKEAAKADDKEVGAGNMTMRTKRLGPEDLRAAGIEPPPKSSGDGPETWYAHVRGRLLDRIEFGATNQVVATRSKGSIVVASRTDPAFDRAGPSANAWKPVAGGESRPYRGGISYAKISRLASPPGALLVEMHGAFAEPHDWFQGAPILRSKFGAVAQDQIRRLRRELQEHGKR